MSRRYEELVEQVEGEGGDGERKIFNVFRTVIESGSVDGTTTSRAYGSRRVTTPDGKPVNVVDGMFVELDTDQAYRPLNPPAWVTK